MKENSVCIFLSHHNPFQVSNATETDPEKNIDLFCHLRFRYGVGDLHSTNQFNFEIVAHEIITQ